MFVRLDSYPNINSMYPELEQDYKLGDLMPCLVHEKVMQSPNDIWQEWFLIEAKSKVTGVYVTSPSYFHDYRLLYRDPKLPRSYGDYPCFWVRSEYVTVIGDVPATNKEAARLLSPEQ